MCWRTNNKQCGEIRVAEQDIPVFKVVCKYDDDWKECHHVDMEKDYYAPAYFIYGGFHYEIGKMQKSDRELYVFVLYDKTDLPFGGYCGEGYCGEVNHGIHSYSSDRIDINCTPSELYANDNLFHYVRIYEKDKEDTIMKKQGYPYYQLDWFSMSTVNPMYRMDCIIPKGTKYVVNEKGEYVSEAIIPVSASVIELTVKD